MIKSPGQNNTVVDFDMAEKKDKKDKNSDCKFLN